MPIKVNNVEITTNKINNNNVSEEKLNGTKIYPSTVYYTVRFYDYSGGSLLKTQQVQQGGNATAPANPTRTGYTFTGWDKSYTNVQSNLNIYGTWQIKTYTVRFYAWDGGSLLKTQTVNHGSSATAPTQPTREGYTFTGWDKSFTNVQSNLVVYGLWQQASFNYYVLRDVGDYNLASGFYAATCPNDTTSPITHTYSQAIIQDAWNWDATCISTNTELHTAYTYTNPNLYTPTQFVAFCVEDLYQYLGVGTTPYIIYEVESA